MLYEVITHREGEGQFRRLRLHRRDLRRPHLLVVGVHRQELQPQRFVPLQLLLGEGKQIRGAGGPVV